jgi:hypothetical protein
VGPQTSSSRIYNHRGTNPDAHNAVGKLLKFKEIGSLEDKPRSGNPSTSKRFREIVTVKVACDSPKKYKQRTTIYSIFKKETFVGIYCSIATAQRRS